MPRPDRFTQSPELAECVGRIEDLLRDIIAIQRPHVAAVCAACPDPCCGRVGHLFDEKDVIFLKLTHRDRDLRRRSAGKRGCAHHTPAGCRLEAASRPFTCHRYLCDRLRKTMTREDHRILPLFQRKLDELDGLRSRMWVCYLESSRT